jgi:hypothetical protein
MMKGAFVRHCALLAACVLTAAGLTAACGGGSKASSSDDAGSPNPPNPPPPSGDDSGAGSDGSSPVPVGGDAAPPTPKTKSIGSPCALGTDCTSGTCDTTVPGGMCTKPCATDTDCAEKGNKTGAACVNSFCYEFCKDLDGGAPVADGGKAPTACKNKAFDCEVVPGETTPVCMYNSEAGAPDSGLAPDAAPADAAGD